MKLYFYVLLFIFLSGCFHETSLISNYGQRIVKIPNQTETTDALNTTKNVNKPNVNLSNKDIIYTNKVEKIDFSSSKFLKGDPSCINIMRVRVLGSLSYDELMYELRKRAVTMGGNAIGIYDLDENKEIIYANKEIDVKNSLNVRYEFMKQTNLLSSVTADIFRCKSNT
tara:strand:+ start:838 stop:1344 length:507 start_codon:yes stop_codon:yes gene_type:complete